MSHFGGGLCAGLGGGLGADDQSCDVEILSNLLISRGCLGLSGLNLTDCASACGGGSETGGL